MRAAVESGPPDEFLPAAEALGIASDPGDVDRWGAYLAMLLDANTRFNLTAITDPQAAWIKHILDSLTLLPFLASESAARVIDVGSGGGLPGLPLAIALPEIDFTLLEATGKKAGFLRGVVAALELANVTVVCERAETIGHDLRHREHYDMAVTRAVGRLAVLLELAVPLVKVSGFVLAIKGRQADQEIKEGRGALHRFQARVAETRRTPTGTVVAVEKLGATPKRYPRRPGEPKRTPLGC